MKKTLLLFFTILFLSCSENNMISVVEMGAVGDGVKDNTEIINTAILRCYENGGGTVIIPKGVFLTATLNIKSGVNLHLEKDATLKAIEDPERYNAYIPEKDMSQYDSGGNSQNANNSKDTRWNRAMILGVNVRNASITGEGVIDGCHIFDPKGEEGMRGPHTILFAESSDILIDNISIVCSANYAFMAYGIKNATFHNLTIKEGWDGIHIRGGENITISQCSFFTGDDSIAGGFWKNMKITDNYINTSCNGIRIIMPVRDLLISECEFKGPGKFPHRTSGPLNRTNMLSAINVQPGGWGKVAGDVENVEISDIEVTNTANPFMFTLNEGNNARNITIRNYKAENMYLCGFTFESWKGGTFENVLISDSEFSFIGNPDTRLNDIVMCQPPADARPLPCWAGYANNTSGFSMRDVKFSYTGEETREPFLFENVTQITTDGVFTGPENALVEML